MASEPKEDYIHFLVLTDVCGNRTYGVVAQYYRPLHVSGSVAVLRVWGWPFVVYCGMKIHPSLFQPLYLV